MGSVCQGLITLNSSQMGDLLCTRDVAHLLMRMLAIKTYRLECIVLAWQVLNHVFTRFYLASLARYLANFTMMDLTCLDRY